MRRRCIGSHGNYREYVRRGVWLRFGGVYHEPGQENAQRQGVRPGCAGRKVIGTQGRALHEHVGNIYTVLANLEIPGGSKLEDNLLDIVLIPNVLFQAEDKYGMISEGARILKKGGQLLIVDWFKEGPFSPREGMIKPEEVKVMAQKLGLEFKKEWMAGDFHYALLFIK